MKEFTVTVRFVEGLDRLMSSAAPKTGVRRGFEININPAMWAVFSEANQCRLMQHEMGHIYMQYLQATNQQETLPWREGQFVVPVTPLWFWDDLILAGPWKTPSSWSLLLGQMLSNRGVPVYGD